uniref:Uncharacterized protein n=1 Tax=Panagrellus redivivus TaxID=6233 RepID=A0A7E4V3A9_PANRE
MVIKRGANEQNWHLVLSVKRQTSLQRPTNTSQHNAPDVYAYSPTKRADYSEQMAGSPTDARKRDSLLRMAYALGTKAQTKKLERTITLEKSI